MAVTPLQWASAKGSLSLVRRLWDRILTADERRGEGPQALFQAVQLHRRPVAEFLLAAGVSPNTPAALMPFPGPGSALAGSVPPGGGVATARGASLRFTNPRAAGTPRLPGRPPLVLLPSLLTSAAANTDVEMCALLLRYGA